MTIHFEDYIYVIFPNDNKASKYVSRIRLLIMYFFLTIGDFIACELFVFVIFGVCLLMYIFSLWKGTTKLNRCLC